MQLFLRKEGILFIEDFLLPWSESMIKQRHLHVFTLGVHYGNYIFFFMFQHLLQCYPNTNSVCTVLCVTQRGMPTGEGGMLQTGSAICSPSMWANHLYFTFFWANEWFAQKKWAICCLQTFSEQPEQISGLGIRSFQKNATFSLSFTFFIKERSVLLRSL